MIGIDIELRQREVSRDRRQDIVEVVRNPACKDPERLEALGAGLLLLEPESIGNIPEDEHRAKPVALLVFDRSG
ncbi:hypothetical protein DSECCO2_487980 [anaerobic digester metagenome]